MNSSMLQKYIIMEKIIDSELLCINKLFLPSTIDKDDLVGTCLKGSSGCLKSCIFLAKGSYIGSSNALLRQAYEFLTWAKAWIDAPNEVRTVIREDFFSCVNSLDLRESSDIKSIFKSLNYSGFPELQCGKSIIERDGKYLYKLYSALTHASPIAQIRLGCVDVEFDANVKEWNFNQIALLTDIYLFVLDQYIEAIKQEIQPKTEMSTVCNDCDIAALLMCRDAIEYQKIIEEKHHEICQCVGDDFEHNSIWLCFIDEWNIENYTGKKKDENVNSGNKKNR